jgi:hypothetical protein
MSTQRRESTLFLSPLDAFTFDFAPATEKQAAQAVREDDDAEHSDGHEDERHEVVALSTPVPTRDPLTLEEVLKLSEAAMTVGSRYFSLPQNAPTFEQASTQYVQVLQRQAQSLKHDFKERQKRREAKKNKRDRETA